MSTIPNAVQAIERLAYTATVQSTGIVVADATMAALYVRLYSAPTGTTPILSAMLQASPDDSNWFDVPCDQVLKTATTTAGETTAGPQRNVVDQVDDSPDPAGLYVGIYKHVPHGLVRAQLIISGVSPSFDVEAWLTWK